MLRNRNPSSRGVTVNDTAMSRGRPERFRGAGWTVGLSADFGTTLVSGNVSAWVDQSGAGATRDLSQGTANNRPLFVVTGLHGYSTVRFDGSNDLMTSSAYTLAQPLHIFTVMKMVTTQAAPNTSTWATKAAGTGTLYVASTPSSTLNFGTGLAYADIVANGAFARVEALCNGANSTLLENDTSRASGNAGTNGFDFLTLGDQPGGANSANVEYGEFHVFTTALGTSQLARFRNRTKAKYGLT